MSNSSFLKYYDNLSEQLQKMNFLLEGLTEVVEGEAYWGVKLLTGVLKETETMLEVYLKGDSQEEMKASS